MRTLDHWENASEFAPSGPTSCKRLTEGKCGNLFRPVQFSWRMSATDRKLSGFTWLAMSLAERQRVLTTVYD